MSKFKISEEEWMGLNRLVDFMREQLDDLHADVDLLAQVTDMTGFNREQLKGSQNIPDGVMVYHQTYLDREREMRDPLHAITKRIALCTTDAELRALMSEYEDARAERDTKVQTLKLNSMMAETDQLLKLVRERDELEMLIKAKNLDERIEELIARYEKERK